MRIITQSLSLGSFGHALSFRGVVFISPLSSSGDPAINSLAGGNFFHGSNGERRGETRFGEGMFDRPASLSSCV